MAPAPADGTAVQPQAACTSAQGQADGAEPLEQAEAEGMQAATKRTYQPSTIVRKRRHGFLSRCPALHLCAWCLWAELLPRLYFAGSTPAHSVRDAVASCGSCRGGAAPCFLCDVAQSAIEALLDVGLLGVGQSLFCNAAPACTLLSVVTCCRVRTRGGRKVIKRRIMRGRNIITA